jgi:hypothetical protein
MRSLSLAALTVLLVLAAGSHAQPPEKQAKWEYAELYVRTVSRPPAEGEERPAPTVTIRWTTGKDETSVTGWAEFAEKIKATGFKKDGSLTLQRLQILNHLGSEGWEMVDNAPSSTTAAKAGAGQPVSSTMWSSP